VDQEGLTALLRDHAKRHAVPGAALGCFRDGRVTTAYYGVADVRTGEPVRPDTLFSLASLTKSMVATVIARLEEQGRLSLGDPVAAHVPELHGSAWARGASVRDLLANRSGLPLRVAVEFDFDGRPDEDDGALSRLVADVARDVPADPFWSYTNLGWCVLGRVIETATGVAWEEAMRRHLADAGMRETTFGTCATTRRRASGHESGVPVKPLVARAYGPAGANAVSTVTDLLRFAAVHLKDRSLAPLREVHARVQLPGWLDAWCLGWARFDWAGGPAWGWDGLVKGERSFLRILPEQRAAIVLMTNGSAGRAMYRSLIAELMATSFGIRVPPLRLDASPGAAGDLSRFAGVYAWPDRRVEVAAAAGRLHITSDEGDAEAVPVDERTFLVDAMDPDTPTVTFDGYDAAGRPRVLYLMIWGLPRLDG
jgi:CubicO group peptidase (beta-lactamase class C family)